MISRAMWLAIVTSMVVGELMQTLDPHPLWDTLLVGGVAICGFAWWARKEIEW